MQISDEIVELVKRHNANFISLKYIDEDGFLRQVDCSLEAYQNQGAFISNKVKLRNLPGKAFLDPFRSQPTITVFCENIASAKNSRAVAAEIITSANNSFEPKLAVRLNFWLEEDDEEVVENHQFIADPIDKHANLRSDIISTLEKIGIKTGVHFHGKDFAMSVVEILGDNIIDLADNIIIARFVIANVVEAYALQVEFAFEEKANLSIIVKAKKIELDKIYDHLRSHVIQILSFVACNLTYGFEVKKIYDCAISDEEHALEIKLVSGSIFVPYLAFIELLTHSSEINMLSDKISQYFHEAGV